MELLSGCGCDAVAGLAVQATAAANVANVANAANTLAVFGLAMSRAWDLQDLGGRGQNRASDVPSMYK
jgi:hypothetical protein